MALEGSSYHVDVVATAQIAPGLDSDNALSKPCEIGVGLLESMEAVVFYTSGAGKVLPLLLQSARYKYPVPEGP